MTEYALRPGTVLHGNSDYTIERTLGAGGFGVTYLARTTVLFGNIPQTVRVAIKEHYMSDFCERDSDGITVLCPGTKANRQQVAMSLDSFRTEARRLADIGGAHPNIVRVNEVFDANGTAYYVMEYLEGQSLWDYISNNGSCDENTVRRFMSPVVDAVAFLHRNRLTHLDIKPDNVMLARTDSDIRPVLIDFGLCKHFHNDGRATSVALTMGVSTGFSPVEQANAFSVFSPTADVYSIAATMLACVLGRVPTASNLWPSGEPEATIASLPLGEGFRDMLVRAMDFRADRRYADASAMLEALKTTEMQSTELEVIRPKSGKSIWRRLFGSTTPAAPSATELVNEAIGLYRDRQFDRAVELFRKSAEMGNSVAMHNLGVCSSRGEGMPADEAEAFHWYLAAARAGYALSQEQVGVRYFLGKGVGKDTTESFRYVGRAAESGSASAMYLYGYFHEAGIGTEADYAKAAEWYTAAVEKGSTDAMFRLGRLYLRGSGVAADIERAGKLLVAAAKAGNGQAVGILVGSQTSFKDCQEVRVWLEANGEAVERARFGKLLEAAGKGDAAAMFSLAECYDYGRGVTKDTVESMKWYRKAAEAGNANAMYYLGRCYELALGDVRERNIPEALRYIRLAAEHGHPAARRRLGM